MTKTTTPQLVELDDSRQNKVLRFQRQLVSTRLSIKELQAMEAKLELALSDYVQLTAAELKISNLTHDFDWEKLAFKPKE